MKNLWRKHKRNTKKLLQDKVLTKILLMAISIILVTLTLVALINHIKK